MVRCQAQLLFKQRPPWANVQTQLVSKQFFPEVYAGIAKQAVMVLRSSILLSLGAIPLALQVHAEIASSVTESTGLLWQSSSL